MYVLIKSFFERYQFSYEFIVTQSFYDDNKERIQELLKKCKYYGTPCLFDIVENVQRKEVSKKFAEGYEPPVFALIMFPQYFSEDLLDEIIKVEKDFYHIDIMIDLSEFESKSAARIGIIKLLESNGYPISYISR